MFKKIFLTAVWLFLWWSLMISWVADAGRFEDDILQVIDGWANELPNGKTVRDYLETEIITEPIGAESIRDFLIKIWAQVVIPLVVFAGIIISIIGFYKLMFWAWWEEQRRKAIMTIVYGIVGTMIMVSSWYVANKIIWWDGDGGVGKIFDFEERGSLNGVALAADVYNVILYPFIKIFLMFAMAWLFIFVLINAFRLIFNNNEDVQGKSFSMLIYAVVWILVMSLAKTIVEFVYGTYDDVIWKIVDSWWLVWWRQGELWRVGKLFNGVEWWGGETLTVVRNVVNWVLWLTTFIVVIMFIYLWYMMLISPNDEEAFAKVKKYLLYVIIWIFIIWFSYVIARMFLVF